MVTSFHIPLLAAARSHLRGRGSDQPPPRFGLRRRRAIAALRRVLIPVLAGLAVLFTLHSVASATATQEVLVAARPLRQGALIRTADVETRTVPAATAWQSAAQTPSEVNGRIAQIDIKPGQLLVGNMIRASPVVPKGFTVVEARLAGASFGIRLGDEVSLAASSSCPAEQTPTANDDSQDGDSQNSGVQDGDAAADANAAQPEGTPSDGDAPPAERSEATCVIVNTAIVMGEAHRDDTGAGVSVPLALPPHDAAIMLSVQEQGAIMAVAK